LALDEQKENDEITNVGEFNFVVEKELIDSYGEFNIDYEDSWLRRGFHIMPGVGGSSC